MVKRRSPTSGMVPDLVFFTVERQIVSGAAVWPQIREWQTKGWVKLSWGNSSQYCGVVLSDAGRAEVDRIKKESQP